MTDVITKKTVIQIRVSEEEKLLWESCAKGLGVSLSGWIRRKCAMTLDSYKELPQVTKKPKEFTKTEYMNPPVEEEKPDFQRKFTGPLTKKMQSTGKMSEAVYGDQDE